MSLHDTLWHHTSEMERSAFVENAAKTKSGRRRKSPVQKRPSLSKESMKARNKRRKAQPRGNIRFYAKTECEKEELFSLLEKVKLRLAENPATVSNYDALSSALRAYIGEDKEVCQPGTENMQNSSNSIVHQYQYVTLKEADEDMYLTTKSAINSLLKKLEGHYTECDKDLSLVDVTRFGHACKMQFSCKVKGCAPVKWDSSPHIEGGKYYVNTRMCHAYLTSGLRKVQYDRFASEAKLGTISDNFVDSVFDKHLEVTNMLSGQSMQMAIGEEQFISNRECQEKNKPYQGIDIITDARHQWRKNAACSDVVAIGEKTKKVLRVETVSRSNEKCSQRHETHGTEKLYNYTL